MSVPPPVGLIDWVGSWSIWKVAATVGGGVSVVLIYRHHRKIEKIEERKAKALERLARRKHGN